MSALVQVVLLSATMKRAIGTAGDTTNARAVGGFRTVNQAGARPAPPGGMPYKPTRCTAMTAKGEACTLKPYRDLEVCHLHKEG